MLLLQLMTAWFAVALLALPAVLVVGRSARLADDDALGWHDELTPAAVPVAATTAAA